MTIGERIKQKILEQGLSLDQLADKMGYKSKTSVFRAEQGMTDLPLSKVKEFAKVLKTTPSYLMGWEDEESKEAESKNLYEIDTSMLTPEEIDTFNKVTGVNKANKKKNPPKNSRGRFYFFLLKYFFIIYI